MSSSDSDSSSADVKPSEMNDKKQVIRQLCPTFRGMAVDNERPSTSKEGHSTMMMVDGQRNEFNRSMKRKLDTHGKCDEREKRTRSKLADPPQVRRNSDVTDSTESGSGGDRLIEDDTERVIQTTLFDDNETYKTTSAVRKTLHGTVYQWKHMMLVVHRAREKGYLFRFATEMDAAEKFDDAVLEYQDPVRGRVHRFLQFKHVSVNGMLKALDLLKKAKDAPFSIVKYFKSWRKIRKNPIFNASRSKEFILCTNIGLDVEELKSGRIKVKESAMDDLLKITVGPKRPGFFKFVNGDSRLPDVLKSRAKASEQEIKEFFEQFILAVNQPNEIELDTIIKNELGAYHQFNLHNVDFIRDSFQNIMVNLLKETGRHSKFLSHQGTATLFEELHRQLSSHITIGLMLSYSIELKDYDIKFEAENSGLQEFLVPSHSLRNSILKLTFPDPTLLTALRVYQAVEQLESYEKRDSWIFIHLEKLLQPDIRDQIFRAFESSISHDLLVIDCGLVSHNEFPQTLWTRLVDILEKIPNKKLILIIQESDSSTVHETRHKPDDDISIIDLAECSRQKLLKKSIIKFQGHEKRTSFGEIFDIHDFDKIESNKLSALKKIIKKETLIQLICGKEIMIGTKIQGLGDIEKYYIPRTIVEHRVIEARILENSQISDLFAIGGIDRETLEKLVATKNRNQPLTESSLRKLDPVKCYILESGREADHFRNICEQNPKRNIHWLQGESGALIWHKSSKSIASLRAFRNTSMDHDNHKRPGATHLTETQLAEHDEKRRIVILTDTAGMGKSTLLTYLAGNMKRDQSSLLVMKVDLPEHTRVLEQEKKKRTFERYDTEGAVNFLVDKLSNLGTDFECEIFKEIFKVTGKAAVLFDGYDEICPDYGHIVIDMARSLAKLRIKRLFVATRPHTSGALEQELVTFPHILKPFSRKNQMNFLVEFWGRELNSNDSDGTIEENLNKHASAVLKILIKLFNPRMIQFTGIPLQTRLMAEAFPYGDEEKLKQFDSSEKPIYVTDLYRCFVDKKFEIFFKEKSSGDHTNLGQKKYMKAIYRMFLMTHQNMALKALFDEKTATALIKCQQKIDETSSSEDEEDKDEGEERSGIVTQAFNGKPHFIHRTYAEYFAAEFLSKKLKDNGSDPQVRKFFVAELLVDSRYEVVRAFLNCLLCHRDQTPEKDSRAFDLRQNFNAHGQTLYHVAAEEHNTRIVRFFSIQLCMNREDEALYNVTESCNKTEGRISLAAQSSKQDADINLVDKHQRTPLMVAAGERVLALTGGLVEGGVDINRESKYGSTPWHQALFYRVGLDIVNYLVENGAEINRDSEYDLTPLHRALFYRVGLDIMNYLVENGAEINRESKSGSTSLHQALFYGLGMDIVKYLVENGVEINRDSEYGLTPLHQALFYRVGLDIMNYLVENGAEINRESECGSTSLHRALSYRVGLNVVKYLVEKGTEINRESEYGSTPLHRALFYRVGLDVVKYLVESGAEINRESEYGSTPLQYALQNGAGLHVVEYLVENGAKIDRKSKDGSLTMHWALRGRAELDVVNYLVEHGADLRCESKDGYTALHYALRGRAELDVVKYLVECGVDINRESKDGYTALHYALQGRAELDVVKYLVEHGAKP